MTAFTGTVPARGGGIGVIGLQGGARVDTRAGGDVRADIRTGARIDDGPASVTRGSSLCDQVHAALFDSLTSGRLRPGDHVVEREWAERLEVSRTPVRQAIQRLAQEGLLEPLRSGGYAVSRPRIEDIVQIYEFRSVVERHTAEGAAGRARVAALSRNLEAARTALAHRDVEGAAGANADFHRLIAEACGQRHFARAVGLALRWTAFYQRTLRAAPGGAEEAERQALRRLEQSVRDHQAIAGCLAAGDAAGAGRTMVRHLQGIGEQLARCDTAAGGRPQAAAR